jgi:hypothetical protein
VAAQLVGSRVVLSSTELESAPTIPRRGDTLTAGHLVIARGGSRPPIKAVVRLAPQPFGAVLVCGVVCCVVVWFCAVRVADAAPVSGYCPARLLREVPVSNQSVYL